MKRRRILIAEDDANIRNGLCDALESEGYEACGAADGKSALTLARQGGFDLLLLDIMMPAMNGYDVCRAIRQQDHKTPIIMLTAKVEEIDKVVGLELGADDYITKPFGLRELLARIAAALRRSSANAEITPTAASFSFGSAHIAASRLEATIDGKTISLTPRELSLLQCFHAHPNQALSRDALLNAAWGIDYQGTTRTLDQHIAQLRKKIEPEPSQPRTLLTVHGHGYRYQPQSSAESSQ